MRKPDPEDFACLLSSMTWIYVCVLMAIPDLDTLLGTSFTHQLLFIRLLKLLVIGCLDLCRTLYHDAQYISAHIVRGMSMRMLGIMAGYFRLW